MTIQSFHKKSAHSPWSDRTPGSGLDALQSFEAVLQLFTRASQWTNKLQCNSSHKVDIVSVLWREEGYTVWNIARAWRKSWERSPRDFPRDQAIFHSKSQLESQYKHSHLANNGTALAIAYTEVIAVSVNVDNATAVELIASVEAVLAAMLTCSQSTIQSHSH